MFKLNRTFFVLGVGVFYLWGIIYLLHTISKLQLDYIDIIGVIIGLAVLGPLLFIHIKKQCKSSADILQVMMLKLIEKKDSKQSLNDQEKHLFELINDFSYGFALLDNQTKIIFINKATCRLLGYPRKKLYHRLFGDFLTEESQLILKEQIDQRAKGYYGNYEIEWIKESGETITIIVNATPLSDANGNYRGSYGTIVDITDRKKTELMLKFNEEKFRSIVQNISDILLITDANGNVKYESPSVVKILGYEPGYYIGKSAFITVHPDDQEIIKDRFTEMIKLRSENVKSEFRVKHARGHWVYLEAFGNNIISNDLVEGVVITARDISERIETEKQIRTAYTIINNSPAVAILWKNDGKFTVEFVSENIENLTGYTAEEFYKGQVDYRNIIYSDDFDMINQEIRKNSDNPDISRYKHSPYRIITKNGETRWIENTTVISRDNGGAISHYQGIMMDVTDRINAVRALIGSENRYRTLIEASPIAIMVYSDDKIVYANPSTLKTLECETINDLLNESPLAGIHPDDREKVQARINRIRTEGGILEAAEEKFVTKKGRVIDVAVTAAMGDFQGKQSIIVMFQDISEKKKAQEALKESEEKYRNLVERANDGIAIVQNYIFKFVNRRYADMLGYTVEEMTNKHFRQFVHPDERAKVEEKHAQKMRGEYLSDRYETAHLTKDGKRVEVELNNGMIQYQGGPANLAIIRDITESKNAKEKLRISEQRFQDMFNSVIEGIAITDKDNNVEYHNPAFALIVEEDIKANIVGKNLINYIPQNMRDKYQAKQELVKSNKVNRYELEIITSHNNKKNILVSLTSKYDSEGNYIGAYRAITDITETKRLQETVSRSQRLETAGKIAAQVAHDFNNLLAPLMAYPDFIKAELPEGNAAVQYLNDIEFAAEKMADINQQLIALSSGGHYNMEPQILNNIVIKAINNIQPLPDTLELKLELDDKLMPVKCGGAQIHQVILNLIANARDAMSDNGTLYIKTEKLELRNASGNIIKIPAGDYIVLTISDTGHGIPDEILLKIFDPFFTTKDESQKRGTGLGLSVVHSVIQDHHGYIDLKTKINNGTSFYLYFPISGENIKSIEEVKIPRGEENILIVDDDMIQQTVTSKLLEKLGYSCTKVSSGEKAVEYLQTNSADLIILDMIMPGGWDGCETYENILKINPAQKAIIVSGYAEGDRVNIALELGAGQFIKKPVTLNTIGSAVRKELDKQPISPRVFSHAK